MSEPPRLERRIALAVAIAAFAIALAALVVAIVRRGGGGESPRDAAVAVIVADARSPDSDVRMLDDKHAVIRRSRVDALIADPMELVKTVRIVPEPDHGGFKLQDIKPGSVVAQLGFHNGDAIRGVNGMNVSTPDEGLQVYMQLKSATRLTIDLERHGTPMQLTIDIR